MKNLLFGAFFLTEVFALAVAIAAVCFFWMLGVLKLLSLLSLVSFA